MTLAPMSFSRIALPLAMCLAFAPAGAQTPREQAGKALARKVPAGNVQACALITRADVKKATGRDPYADAEPAMRPALESLMKTILGRLP